MTDIKTMKKALQARREELEGLSRGAAQSRAAVELDQQSVGRLSRMDAMQQQAMAQASERQRVRELTAIEQALQRIEDGDYGFCASCDEEIAEKRLAMNPATALCIKCATSQEK